MQPRHFVALVMLTGLLTIPASVAAKDDYKLIYVSRFNIKNTALGLTEPSGLCFTFDKKALWTVSDDTKTIFRISPDGKVSEERSIPTPMKGFEGIAGGQKEFVIIAREDGNEVVLVHVPSGRVIESKPLSAMQNYAAVAEHFSKNRKNKGLEGITWNSKTNSLFAIKEGNPGVLIEISADLSSIKNQRIINYDNGFIDDVGQEKLDFSGIAYDEKRDAFWIVSDKGQRLFLYDWSQDSVLFSTTLSYLQEERMKKIEKAEGVAIDTEQDRLYVVSDKKAELYVFDIKLSRDVMQLNHNEQDE